MSFLCIFNPSLQTVFAINFKKLSMKRIVKVFPVIIFSFILLLIACEQDDNVSQNNEQAETQKSELKIHVEGGEHFRNLNPTIYQKLKRTSRHAEVLTTAKNGTEEINFSLDLNTIQIIERNTYTQYTTTVLNHSEQEIYLINYMFLEFNDGAEYQFLIKYPRIITDQGVELDRTNAVMEAINGETILNKSGIGGSRPCLNGVPEIVNSYQVYQCTEFRCTGDGHSVGEECNCGQPGYSCTTAFKICQWETVNTWGCSGGGTSSGGNDGTAGGGNNDPNDDPNDDPIETVPFVPHWQRVVDCVNDGFYGSFDSNNPLPLSTQDIEWLQSPSGSVYASEISSYIAQQGCEGNKDFLDEAVEALRNNDDVDFINEIIFKIDQNCAEDIAKKIVNNSSQLSQAVLAYFNQDKNYIIKYSNTDVGGTAAGATSMLPTCENGKCTFDIFLDNDMLNGATDLVMAKVILHETIHATLNYLFHSGQFTNQGLDPNSANDPNYKELVEAFTKVLAAENPDSLLGNIDDLEHQYMITFVDDMVNTLKTVGVTMGYDENSTQLSDSYLRDLVWSGSLESTDAFGEEFTFEEQQRINSRGLAELTNSPASYQIIDENGIPITTVIQPLSNVINNSNSPCFPN